MKLSSSDKRFGIAVFVITAVLVLVACNRAPSSEVLAFLGSFAATFLINSSVGESRRKKLEAGNALQPNQ